MKTVETVNMRRREFLSASSILLLGAASLNAAPFQSSATPKGPDLLETLSPDELTLVQNSLMSEDMQNFWHKGYSCAETGLIVALRYMKKPEELVWTAAGFGGGMGQQDLCGFLTSGIMAIGLHAGDLKMEQNAARTQCGQKVSEFWAWWKETAPLHCSEIRQGHQGFDVCQRIGRLATAKVETLLQTMA